MLITILAAYNLPKMWTIFSNPKPKEAPPRFPAGVWPLYYVAAGFKQNAIFGILFVLGLLLPF